jgi:hypothetical protein
MVVSGLFFGSNDEKEMVCKTAIRVSVIGNAWDVDRSEESFHVHLLATVHSMPLGAFLCRPTRGQPLSSPDWVPQL